MTKRREPILEFTPEEMRRLEAVRKSLCTTFPEFIHFVTMQAVTEYEGLSQDHDLIRKYYREHQ